MYQILTLNKIAKCGLDRLNPAQYHVTEDISNEIDGIILRSYAMHDMELPENLKAISRAGAGTNNIPVAKCSDNGIVVFNTPGANANAVKELTICALLLASRKITDGIAWANTLTGDDVAKQVEKGKAAFKGCEIKGKTLGIIGLGAIGVLVANAATRLGMHVIGYDPYLSINAAWNLDHHVEKANAYSDVFENSDYITVHVPLTDDTREFINEQSITSMKDGVKILNFSRGELVNNSDIKKALDEGKVSCYVVDFPNADVVNHPGIIAVPHLGASTEESEDNCAVMAADEMSEFLETGDITNSVNFPNCSLPMGAPGRVTVVHKNIPNMISRFTGVFADVNVNISDMINKSKGEVAYTIINSDHPISEDMADRLAQIDGVLKVRVIK